MKPVIVSLFDTAICGVFQSAIWGCTPWEGARAPRVPSVRSTAYGLVNQLRDPAIFLEDGKIYLLYAVAGESGIAIAGVTLS